MEIVGFTWQKGNVKFSRPKSKSESYIKRKMIGAQASRLHEQMPQTSLQFSDSDEKYIGGAAPLCSVAASEDACAPVEFKRQPNTDF
jgi:hypothetical protein